MGYGNRIVIDVFGVGRKKKMCCLYDSEYDQDGAAHDIRRRCEMNGWKQ